VPQTLRVFIKYSEWLQIEPKWTVTSYVSFVTQFMLSVGLTFEAPLVILILVRLGILSQRALRGGRKMMIAAAVVVAAILAPPDPFSMMLMALPLVIVFEITIWLAWFVERRQDKRR
jgi:sec-independent protein translocase protein TatC